MVNIPPVKYAGSVAHFRGQMDRFLALKGEILDIEVDNIEQSKKYRITYFSYAQNSTREVWNIFPVIPIIDGKRGGNSKFAMILAIENQPGNTIVEFLDGRCYERTAYAPRGITISNSDMSPAHLAMYDPIGDDFIEISNRLRNEIQSQILENKVTIRNDLWELVPNKKWYRQALKLWHEGLTAAQISKRLGISTGRIYNLFSNLRKEYGDEIVPLHK